MCDNMRIKFSTTLETWSLCGEFCLVTDGYLAYIALETDWTMSCWSPTPTMGRHADVLPV